MKTEKDITDQMPLERQFKVSLNVPGYGKQLVIVHEDDNETTYHYIGTILMNGKVIQCKSENTRVLKTKYDAGTRFYEFIMSASDDVVLDYVLKVYQITNLWYIINTERRKDFYNFSIVRTKEDNEYKLTAYYEEESEDDSCEINYRKIAYSTEPGKLIYVANGAALVSIKDISKLELVSTFMDKDPVSCIKDLDAWSFDVNIFNDEYC